MSNNEKNLYIWYNGVATANNDLIEYINERSPVIEDKEFLKHLMVGYAANAHHFKLGYHYDVVIPRMLDFAGVNFNRDDFKTIPYKDGRHDLSYLFPKASHQYSIDVFVRGIKYHLDGNYSKIINVNKHFTKSAVYSGYHRLFVGSHSIFHMKNKTISESAPKMLIVGDSQTIPDIPVLCHYCKELIYIDIRCDINAIKQVLKGYKYDKCIVEFYNDKLLSLYRKFDDII